MKPVSRSIVCLVLGLAPAALCACALIDSGLVLLPRADDPLSTSSAARRHFKPIVPAQDAMKLDIILVERPAGDELLGPALWQEVDQLGAIPFSIRDSLMKHGFRVGHVASKPPPALESILAWAARKSEYVDSQDPDHISHQVLYRRNGEHTEIKTGRVHENCRVLVPGVSGSTEKEYTNAQFVMRMRATRLQDGWAELEFIPEIHHGELKPRYQATRHAWQNQLAQQVEPLFSQQFSVKLLVGEMAVLSVEGNDPLSLGRHFFLTGGDGEPEFQRLLVVRLSDMKRIEGNLSH